jgi:hypothetical protein
VLLDHTMGDWLYAASEDVDHPMKGSSCWVIDWEGHSSESFAYLHLVCSFEN